MRDLCGEGRPSSLRGVPCLPARLDGRGGRTGRGLFWCEDVDFCLRAARVDIASPWSLNATWWHIGGRSARTNRALVLRRQYLSAVGFFQRHGDAAQVRKAIAMLVGELWVKTVVWALLDTLRPMERPLRAPRCTRR